MSGPQREGGGNTRSGMEFKPLHRGPDCRRVRAAASGVDISMTLASDLIPMFHAPTSERDPNRCADKFAGLPRACMPLLTRAACSAVDYIRSGQNLAKGLRPISHPACQRTWARYLAPLTMSRRRAWWRMLCWPMPIKEVDRLEAPERRTRR